MGLLGLAYTHSDLGGFAGGEAFDREMYIRWLQYGVFQPVYRPHAQEHIAPEPVFHDRETRRIVGDFIRLRYRLLPYVYTLAWENSTTGMPLMRPLFFEDESDPALIDRTDAYLWGNAFLVAPVTAPGVGHVDIDLPAGTWFDFWNERRYDGGRTVSVPVTMETIPVLVRAGSFVPMIDDIQTTRDYSGDALTLHYYADVGATHSQYVLYDDDGSSRTSLEDGAFELLTFTAERRDGALSIGLSRRGGNYPGEPDIREITLVVHNWSGPVSSVMFGDTVLPLKRRLPRHGDAAARDAERGLLRVRVSWDHSTRGITIRGQRDD